MVGGVSLDGVFTSTGESGIVECFSVRSGGRHHEQVIFLLKHLRCFVLFFLSGVHLFYKQVNRRTLTPPINKVGLSTEV